DDYLLRGCLTDCRTPALLFLGLGERFQIAIFLREQCISLLWSQVNCRERLVIERVVEIFLERIVLEDRRIRISRNDMASDFACRRGIKLREPRIAGTIV